MTNDKNDLLAGRSITCETGHVVATAWRDTAMGTGDWMDDLEWIQRRPAVRGDTAACEVCGRPWQVIWRQETEFRGMFWQKAWMCVDGAWEPELTPEARKWVDGYVTKPTPQ